MVNTLALNHAKLKVVLSLLEFLLLEISLSVVTDHLLELVHQLLGLCGSIEVRVFEDLKFGTHLGHCFVSISLDCQVLIIQTSADIL
jgi:hypothetical protein